MYKFYYVSKSPKYLNAILNTLLPVVTPVGISDEPQNVYQNEIAEVEISFWWLGVRPRKIGVYHKNSRMGYFWGEFGSSNGVPTGVQLGCTVSTLNSRSSSTSATTAR